jgi:oligopeptide/dipeptide ABC transporter ATP-binding protein
MNDSNLLEVKNLSVVFGEINRKKRGYKAVNNVSFTLKKGETLGLVGESGCGKTTLGRTIIRLQKENSGNVLLNGIDLCSLSPSQLRPLRRQMQMIFQNPYSSLNPRMTVLEIIAEPFTGRYSREEKTERVSRLMMHCGLDPEMMRKFPHEFSGGQRQRIAIARSIAADPMLIIADEPVSSLDVSVQAQILNVLKSLKDSLSLTMLFISHDLSVVRYISQRVAVMYRGNIVEIGKTEDLFKNPCHPYTKELLDAVPVIDPERKIYQFKSVQSTDSDFSENSGCPFFNRCSKRKDECRLEVPKLSPSADEEGHCCACIDNYEK